MDFGNLQRIGAIGKVSDVHTLLWRSSIFLSSFHLLFCGCLSKVQFLDHILNEGDVFPELEPLPKHDLANHFVFLP